jgi:hypothetical protein
MCDMKTVSFSDASSSRSDCSLAIADAGMDPWAARVYPGPVQELLRPSDLPRSGGFSFSFRSRGFVGSALVERPTAVHHR